MNTALRLALGLSALTALSATTVGCSHDHREARAPHGPTETTGAHPVGAGGEHRDDHNDKRVEANTNWEKLGERTVNGANDHDSIGVGKKEGRFSKLQIKVEHSALEMFEMKVEFEDGTSYQPQTRLVFKNGDLSKEIDLPGGARTIKKVDFRYGNLAGGGNAQVELWAR